MQSREELGNTWVGVDTGTGTHVFPMLEAGEYQLDINSWGSHKDGDSFTVSVYSGEKVDLSFVKESDLF